MPKKVKVEMTKLIFTGACSGKYWDNGSHNVKPGDVVEFCDKMAQFHLKEPVWEVYKEPVKQIKDGEK